MNRPTLASIPSSDLILVGDGPFEQAHVRHGRRGFHVNSQTSGTSAAEEDRFVRVETQRQVVGRRRASSAHAAGSWIGGRAW